MIDLIDGNNWFRRRIEDDRTGRAPRTAANWINARQDTDPIIFVWDGVRANNRRKAVYPGYKDGRKPAAEGIYQSIAFFRDEVLPLTKAISIRVPEYEADDVIATMAISFAGRAKQTKIHSNDFDLKQLEVPGLIEVMAKAKDGVPPSLVRLYKTWVGDPSDNIPGVKGFGQKAWEAVDKPRLVELTQKLVDQADADTSFLAPKFQSWLHDNHEQLVAMWTITGLIPVDPTLVGPNTRAGSPDLVRQNDLFKRYML
jgi:hypothetical protein